MGVVGLTARRAIFLDRDGVINRNVYNAATGAYEAPHAVADVALHDGALEALLKLQNAGFDLFIVSNQPDYALGKASRETIEAIQAALVAKASAAGVIFTAAYVCLHHPRGVTAGVSGPCECRKPSPYFLNLAAADYGLDLAASWMIGDRVSDIDCGQAAGVRTVQVAPDHPGPMADATASLADLQARDLADAARLILGDLAP
jgi:D-glycero-D-manno-heptose 1,7-bisphosphate phosphatase